MASCQSNKVSSPVIRVLRGLQSVWGLGTPLERITPHCQVVAVLQKPQRRQHFLKHHQIWILPVEGGWIIGTYCRGCVWWDMLECRLLCPYGGKREDGSEQEKQTGPCLRAELGEGESSTLCRDGLSGPSAFMFRCLSLLAAWSPATCLPLSLSVYLSGRQDSGAQERQLLSRSSLTLPCIWLHFISMCILFSAFNVFI